MSATHYAIVCSLIFILGAVSFGPLCWHLAKSKFSKETKENLYPIEIGILEKDGTIVLNVITQTNGGKFYHHYKDNRYMSPDRIEGFIKGSHDRELFKKLNELNTQYKKDETVVLNRF